MANTSFTDTANNLIATTLRHHKKKFYDNIFKNWVFWDRIRKMGQVSEHGGREILVPLVKAKNSTFKSYAPYETFDVSQQEYANVGITTWRHAGGTVSYAPEEEAMNRGPEGMIPLVKSAITNLQNTVNEGLSDMLLTAFEAAGNSNKDLDPVNLAILRDPIGTDTTYCSVNGSSESTWRNQTSDNTGVTTQAGIRLNLLRLLSACSKGTGGAPDFGLCDLNTFDFLQNLQSTQQRNDSNIGFPSVSLRGVPIVADESLVSATDGGAIGNSNGVLYLFNSQFMNLEFLLNRSLEVGEFIEAQNSTVQAAKVTTSLSWYLTNRRKFGVAFSIASNTIA